MNIIFSPLAGLAFVVLIFVIGVSCSSSFRIFMMAVVE